MTREAATQILERIALLLELKGENPFKIRAYRTGADIVSGYAGDIMKLAADGALTGIKGLGDALKDKLHEMATTGRLEFYEKLKGEFSDSIFELFDLQGLGPKKIALLYANLGVASIEDLKRACASGEASASSGDAKSRVPDGMTFRPGRNLSVAGFGVVSVSMNMAPM